MVDRDVEEGDHFAVGREEVEVARELCLGIAEVDRMSIVDRGE